MQQQAARKQQDNLVLAAIHNSKRVTGLTHSFYKYPARFSPEFAKTLIHTFSAPGALVFDPFMGGGTTAVEALTQGRRFLGTDISSLAYFVARAKTNLLTSSEVEEIQRWSGTKIEAADPRKRPQNTVCSNETKHVPWHLRKQIQTLLDQADRASTSGSRTFIRAAILKTAQWALDCRTESVSQKHFREQARLYSVEMLQAYHEYETRVLEHFGSKRRYLDARRLLNIRAEQVDRHHLPRSNEKVDLIVTSPPYIGVHVLYHRWQIHGRRETPAPFWIAGKADGHGGSFYTFADRRSKETSKYFNTLHRSFQAAANLLKPNGYLFQLVAFADAENQLPIYLETMEMAGFSESHITNELRSGIKRQVPNQKWYAAHRSSSQSSNEFFLCHKKRG